MPATRQFRKLVYRTDTIRQSGREGDLSYPAYEPTTGELAPEATGLHIEIEGERCGVPCRLGGSGPDLLAALFDALDVRPQIVTFERQAISPDAKCNSVCYLELRVGAGPSVFGVGLAADADTAVVGAALSALNRSTTIPARSSVPAAVATAATAATSA